MNIFSRAIQNYSNQTSTIKNPEPWLLRNLGINTKGVTATDRKSLELSAFYSGVNIISNHIASLPINIVKRDENGNTEDLDHQLNEILKYQSSPYLSATHFKKLLIVHALVYGNGFARIERSGNNITGLHIEKPKDTDIFRDKSTREVFYKFKDIDRMYSARDVIHIYDFTLNGYSGLSVLEAGARNSFEGHLSVQNFSNRYFENNAHIGGILSTDDSLGTEPSVVNEAKSQVRKEFEQVYNGQENWFKTAILEGSWNYESLDVKASDAMLIERAQATVEDISRWLQMPSSFLTDKEATSYKAKEADARSYVNNCLNPKIKLFQNEIRNKLFTESEKEQGYTVLIDTKQLVRASLADTGDFLSQMIDRSIFTIDDALDFLDMDTVGLDIRMQQKNMGILGEESPDEEAIENLRDSLNKILDESK
ncbi:phage portal protein [Aliifodinibius sp. S!AR15-10]|uniref:phage portal protein n=1 Tax=Aliifodinibius sp. S!AR15-10 TaxID=2950437 RepID=UPI00285F5C99|nr:phage portal protein [Aliifodinibius sp. S!AR15-10]MDR8390988.1 phage portal protein [Aliifodinibius sp. S!AR15-10]